MIVWKLQDPRTGVEFYVSPLRGNWISGYAILAKWELSTLGL